MGCCSPNFRKTVCEQEERVNRKGNDRIPFFIKAVLILITVAGGLLAVFLQ